MYRMIADITSLREVKEVAQQQEVVEGELLPVQVVKRRRGRVY
jgi:hypothetical protein